MRGYDIVIVGGGTAGCVLANRLSADPQRQVLLIEAGPDVVAGHEPADITDLFPRSHANPRYRYPNLKGHWLTRDTSPLSTIQQARTLGGGSAIMGMIALRGTPADYRAWEAAGAVGWGWDDILPYFRRLESDEDFGGPHHGGSGPTHIRRHPSSVWPPLNQAGAAYAARNGLASIADVNADFRNGHGSTPIFATATRRSSSAYDYVSAEVRARPNLTILTDAVVTGLKFDGRRVTGVVVQSARGEMSLPVGEVVLSLGAVLSPQILLRAGIGDAEMLKRSGVAVRHHLPGVGRNLQNHAMMTIVAPLRASAQQRRPERNHNNSFFRFSATSASAGEADLGLFYGPRGTWHALAAQMASFGLLLLSPRSRGQITLGAGAAPVIEYNLLGDESDLLRLEDGLRFAARLICSPEMRPLIGRAIALSPANRSGRFATITTRNTVLTQTLAAAARLLPGLSGLLMRGLDPDGFVIQEEMEQGALHEHVRKSVVGVGHHAGTCRMGLAADPLAVVDSAGRVHGLAGLRVVDASVMPTVPRGNTNLPTLMVAEKMAAAIESDWRRSRRPRPRGQAPAVAASAARNGHPHADR